MNIEYRDGLLFTSIEISYKGNSKIINDVVIDTGAAGSIISPDIVDDIGIYAELDDRIMEYYGVGGSVHHAFIKNIQEIKIGNESIDNIEIDFGLIDNNGEINGLIGLDILIKIGAVIDLKHLIIKIEK
jgi:predicted aspartyl protease